MNEDLLRRLPLPLGQLYRRAHNAKTALERHLTAFSFWEAGLKLLACVAIAEYAARGADEPATAERLRNLSRPALGHWWEFVRRLAPSLADGGDEGFRRLRDLLLGDDRDDLPFAAGLNSALRQALEGKGDGRPVVRVAELFDRLVEYRNKVLGHAAPGQLRNDFNERMARALLAGAAELFGRLDVLAGRRLLYVGEVRQSGGAWLVQRYELVGESPHRLESLELPREAADRLPDAERVYLEEPGPIGAGSLRPLHPLVVYDAEPDEFLFLNARRGGRRGDYLCYTTGRTAGRPEWGGETPVWLARVMGEPVREAGAAGVVAEAAAEEEAPAPGRRTLGEFTLLSELGRGGMGLVYRAWQPSLGRQVALKTLLAGGDPKAEARFRREIRALGRVEHPNLVKIFTSGSDGDRWFYAMELVEGAPLSAVCDRLRATSARPTEVDDRTWKEAISSAYREARGAEKPLSDTGPAAAPPEAASPEPAPRTGPDYVRQAVELVRQAARAAHALHEGGIVHRDIKPGNILVSVDGTQAVLMDLGLAQLADEMEGRLTRTRQFVGTLRYASPQQVLAAAKLDRRSDVYSLGATLWELLTLRPLFDATDATPTPVLMERIQYAEPQRPRKHHPGLPRDLEAVVVKCLEKDPDRRYATAQDLANDLESWLNGRPVRAHPLTVRYVAGKYVRRHRLAITAAAAFLLAALSLAALEVYRIDADRRRATDDAGRFLRERDEKGQALNDAREAHDKEAAAHAETVSALASARAARAEADHNFYAADMQLAERAWEDRNVGRALELLEATVPSAGQEDLRGFEWYHLWRLCNPDVVPIHGHAGPVTAVAFNPEMSTFWTGGVNGSIKEWPIGVEGLDPKRVASSLTGLNAGIFGIAFTADSKVTAMAFGGGNVAVAGFDASGGPVQHLLQHSEKSDVRAVSFSPDGRTLASGGLDGIVKVWDWRTGKLLSALNARAGIGAKLKVDDRGAVVTEITPGGAAALDGRLRTGDRLVRISGADGVPAETAGMRLKEVLERLRGPSGSVVRVEIEPQDGSERISYELTRRPIDSGGDAGVKSVAFSPDGKVLASGSNDHMVRLWDPAGGDPAVLSGHTNYVNAVAFSPDGKTLASGSGDGTAILWDVEKRERRLTLTGHLSHVNALAFSHDGALLVTGATDRTVKLWDVKTGKEKATLGHSQVVRALAFDPTDRWLVSGCNDGTVRFWDLRIDRRETATGKHALGVAAVAVSPDGSWFITGSFDHTAKLWDAAGPREMALLKGHENHVHDVAISPAGKLAATASCDCKVRLWDATNTATPKAVLSHDGEALCMAFRSDGKVLFTAGGERVVRAWDVAGARVIRTFDTGHTAPIRAMALSPDDRLLATGGDDNTVRLWTAADGKCLGVVDDLQAEVDCVCFSPDGKWLIGGDRDGNVKVWDAGSRQPRATLTAHQGAVWFLAVSPDGRRLATGSEDGTVRVWDVPGFQELIAFRERKVTSGRFTPDGQTLILGGSDGSVSLWRSAGLRDVAVYHTALENWVRVVADWSAVLGRGENLEARLSRGRAYTELGEWEKAATDFGKASREHPDNSGASMLFAIALLAGGDAAGYRETCRGMAARLAPDADPETANDVAFTCALTANVLDDYGPLLLRARKGEAANPMNYQDSNTLGAVLCRAGRGEEAIDQLNAAIKIHGTGGTAYDWLFLALAHLQLGHDHEARQLLDRAVAWIEKARTGEEFDVHIGTPLSGMDRAQLDQVRREVEAALASGGGQSK